MPRTPSKGFLNRIKANAQKALKRNAGVNDKMQIVGTIRQHLAEVADLANKVGEEDNAANEAASVSAKELLDASLSGIFSNEEISAMLGDVFGYRETSTGNQSKTPDGMGKAIRDRVFRMVKAADYATSGDGDRFFQPLDQTAVAEIVQRVENNELSIWQAHRDLTELRKGNNPPRIAPAHDPRAIAKIVGGLTEKGAAKVLADSPDLVTAYLGLLDALDLYGIVEAWNDERQAEAA
jgi:hypothetical protein